MKKEYIIKEGHNKYFKVPIKLEEKDSSETRLNAEFDKLLLFIGKNKPYKNRNEYGSAYIAIKQKTNALLGLTKKDLMLKTSKREIASIRFYYKNLNIQENDKSPYVVKIPFKLEYIFRAIVILVEEIESEGIDIPNNLQHLVNQLYKTAFYNKQKEAYNDKYPTIPERFLALRAFHDDFDTPDSSLNKVFQ
jgi:hypothetical protein